MNLIKCPNCGESYYRENDTISTAVYYPPIYKNGVNINPDGNTHTTYCTCLNCKNKFYYSMKFGEIIEIKGKGPSIDENTVITINENGKFI